MSSLEKNSHCSYCGNKFSNDKKFPVRCTNCNNITYVNPLPVIVAMVPVLQVNGAFPAYDSLGLLIQKRNIEPGKGLWAFPGGYMELGETWQEAASRELKEEVGIIIPPERFSLSKIDKSNNGNILIFALSNFLIRELDIKNFVPNDEVAEVSVAYEKMELAFPTHTSALEKYFKV